MIFGNDKQIEDILEGLREPTWKVPVKRVEE